MLLDSISVRSVLQCRGDSGPVVIGQVWPVLSPDWLMGARVQWSPNTHGDGDTESLEEGAALSVCNGTASGPVYELHTTPCHHQSCPGRQSGNMFTKSLTLALLAAVAVSGARVRRDDGYGAPEPDTYGAPAEAYGAPVESYGVSAPSYGAAETGLDLTTIIIPLLALLGLFLLFPTYVTLSSVRRKREAIDTDAEVSAVERMMDMYQVNRGNIK